MSDNPVAERREFDALIEEKKPVPRWRRWVHSLSLLLASFLLGLLVLRLIFRDRFLGTEVLFWAPFWVLAVPAIFVTLGLLGWRPKVSVCSLILLVSAGTILLEQPLLIRSSTLNSKPAPQDSLSLLVWNVMMYNKGKRNVIEGFNSVDADISMFLEGTSKGAVPDFLSAELSTDYTWVSTRQLAVGSKLQVLDSGELPTDTDLRVFRVLLRTYKGEELVLMLIDLPSPPRYHSSDCFRELEEILKAEQGKPLIVTGDFNTPRGSYWLRRVFQDFQDVYTTAPERQGGWIASFPNHFPIVQIDHAFASREITLHRAELLAGDASDHYRQYIVFSISAIPGAKD